MKISNQTIHIEGLRLFAHHGVLEQERRVGAEFLVSLTIETDFTDALLNDKLEGTINYALVYEKVKEEMSIPSSLLEHAAGRIAQRLYHDFPTIQSISVRLDKCNPPMGAQCQACGVEIKTVR